MKRFISFLLFFLIITSAYISFANNPPKKEEKPVDNKDLMDRIKNIVGNITCETQALFESDPAYQKGEMPHTCTSAEESNFFLSTLTNLGPYPSALLKTRINYNGQCDKSQKADYYNPTINFSLCRNVRIESIFARSIAMGAEAFTNKDELTKSIVEKFRKLQFESFDSKKPGDSGSHVDLPTPFKWRVEKIDDKICLTVNSWFSDNVPIGCKYIKSPTPTDFSNNTCDQDIAKNSKALVSITGRIVECTKRRIISTFMGSGVTHLDQLDKVQRAHDTNQTYLSRFQKNMKRAVKAFLTLYISFLSIKIMLGKFRSGLHDVLIPIIQVILVAYFSIGIPSKTGENTGIIDFVYPISLGGAGEIASWVGGVSTNGLCSFPTSEYSSRFKGLAFFDNLDCSVMYYLGIQGIADAWNINKHSSNTAINFPIPPYLLLIIPAILTGNIYFVMLALAYPLLIISFAAFAANTFLISLILSGIISTLAPIFVPMSLFEYTKPFFVSWYKLIISFTLQPVIIATFVAFTFNIIGYGIYGECKFTTVKVKLADVSHKVFFINDNKADYEGGKFQECQATLGWIMMHPFNSIAELAVGIGGGVIDLAKATADLFSPAIKVHKENLVQEEGAFMKTNTVPPGSLMGMISAMLTSFIVVYLCYEVSKSISTFASGITGGVSLGEMGIGAQTLFQQGMELIGAAEDASGGSDAAASDKMSGEAPRSGLATDKASSSSQQKGGADKSSTSGNDGASDNDKSGEKTQQNSSNPNN